MFRVALVGSGGMARQYRQVYTRLPGVEWALAVDTSDAVLEECRQLGVKQVSKNFADALADGIDMVDISTPNFLHAEQAVAAMQAGKHVLLQKPISNTLEDADRIVAAARQTKRTVGMFMSSYTYPAYWEIREMIRRGTLGKIQSIRARDAHRGGLAAKPSAGGWRSSREKTGGGSFIQLSIHAINMMQWLLDADIERVGAFSANQYCPGIGGDDVTVASTQFSGNLYGVFESGYASERLIREIYGTGGWISYSENDHQLTLRLDTPYEGLLIQYTTPGERQTFALPGPRLDETDNPYNQHRQFIEAAMAGKPAPISVETGRRDLAIVKAVYAAAESGKVVEV